MFVSNLSFLTFLTVIKWICVIWGLDRSYWTCSCQRCEFKKFNIFFSIRDGIGKKESLDLFFNFLIFHLIFQAEEQSPVASSPPFFCGSPPSRVANPVVHDIRFGEDHPLTPTFSINNGPHPVAMHKSGTGVPMSPRKGCVRSATKFGFQPAAVRVEGFDCLENRDRRRHGITAVA